MKYTKIIFSLVFVYIFFGMFLYFFQSSFIYFPSNQDFYDCDGFLGFDRLNYNNTNFYFLNSSSDNVLVYYHGNAGSLCDRSSISDFFIGLNYSLLFVEYSGYGADGLFASKDLILSNVLDVGKFIEENNFSDAIVVGSSIGSGPASFHSFSFDANKVVLLNPFDSLENVAKERFFFYPVGIILREDYDNVFWLEGFNGSVHIFHSERDEVMDPKYSKALFNSLNKTNNTYTLIEGAGHNDLWAFEDFIYKLRSIILSR